MIVNQYERGVKLTLGKYSGIMRPGLHFILPLVQSVDVVDIRQRIIDLPKQSVITKDQVNLKIDGLVFYSVIDPKKSVLNVENLKSQITAKAMTELKEIMGNKTIKESLSQREVIANQLKKQLEKAILDQEGHGGDTGWGIQIRDVQINDISLPEDLTRAMAKQAEAVQEKEARVTKAEGELEASVILKKASMQFKDNNNAMKLRELQTYQEIGTEQNTLMLVVPSGVEYSGMADSALVSRGIHTSLDQSPKKYKKMERKEE